MTKAEQEERRRLLEDRARSRWCPFSRISSANRDNEGQPLPGCFCIADKCMAYDMGTGGCRFIKTGVFIAR